MTIEQMNAVMTKFGMICAKVTLPSALDGFAFFHLDTSQGTYSGNPTQSHVWSITQFPAFDFGHDDWRDSMHPRMRVAGSLAELVQADSKFYLGVGESDYYPNGYPSYRLSWLTNVGDVSSLRYLLLVQEDMWKFCQQDRFPNPTPLEIAKTIAKFKSIPLEDPITLLRLLESVTELRRYDRGSHANVFYENPGETSFNVDIYSEFQNIFSNLETLNRVQALLHDLQLFGLSLSLTQVPRSR